MQLGVKVLNTSLDNFRSMFLKFSLICICDGISFPQAIVVRGGRFLEAPIVGTLDADEEPGQLIIVAAGDASLFEDCSSMFNAVAKRTFYIGQFQCLVLSNCLLLFCVYILCLSYQFFCLLLLRCTEVM